MADPLTTLRPDRPETWPPVLRWVVLAIGSVALAALLELARLPAALLLGPMAAAVVLAVTGGVVRLPSLPFAAAQGVVGVMIASKIPIAMFGEIVRDWPIFLAGVVSTVVASAILGWLMMRSRLLPGTTAIWGSSPGAAAVMTLMSADYGADMRLVAVMQYLRVIFCALFTMIVARFFGASAGAAEIVWFPPVPPMALAETLALAAVGVFIGTRLKMPAGALILPMGLGLAAQGAGVFPLELPPWLLAPCYAVIGWGVGGRFTRDSLLYAARALPWILASILALIAVCAGFGVALTYLTDVDMMTAYLATSPGGADSVAIIAISTGADLPFVMDMQLARFFLVMLAGPTVARLLSKWATGEKRSR